MRKSTESAITTKNDILRVSWLLFKKFGYHNTTYRMIADELGISLGTITYHFGGKSRILYTHYMNYEDALRTYVRTNLTKGFNYYLHTSIVYLRFFREILPLESTWLLFHHEEYNNMLERDITLRFERRIREIMDDFHRDHDDEQLRIASLMCLGASANLNKSISQFSDMDVDRCCYEFVYLVGALSRLDEATITNNLRRANEFIADHDFSNIMLGEPPR